MKPSLQAGIEHEFVFRVPQSKTVPGLYPEAEEFQVMPDVLATGFLGGWCSFSSLNLDQA